MIWFLITFILTYVWHTLGVTIGYHRLLSHRSFNCPKFLEYFFILSGYLSMEGSPIWWIAMHRAHHLYADLPRDPHSPRFGLPNAFFFWMWKPSYPSYIDPASLCKDIFNDPLYRFLEQGGNWYKAHILTILIGVAVRIPILICFGWVIALASLMAAGTVVLATLFVNVVGHSTRFGYRTYFSDDDSVNIWWAALISLGEGWHNNHQSFPHSARIGYKWYEFDFSWLVLRILQSMGLVDKLHQIPQTQLIKSELKERQFAQQKTLRKSA